MSRKGNSPIRWGLNAAAVEFGVDEASLNRYLRAGEHAAGPDGCWSTRQVFKALAGDIDAEKLRETRHKANLLELQELELRRKMIPAEQVSSAWEAVIVGLRQGILNSDLTDQKKRDLLDELRQIPVDDYFKTAKVAEEE